jgi:hypothetical protein
MKLAVGVAVNLPLHLTLKPGARASGFELIGILGPPVT